MTTSQAEMSRTTRSPDATEAMAAVVARALRGGDVVALAGDLGAGKTCFVRGLARGLGVTATVSSPTFVLVHEHRGRLPLYHVDLYRIADIHGAAGIGIEEILPSLDGVTAIEWAERIADWIPPEALRVSIDAPDFTTRRWRFDGGNDVLARIGAELAAGLAEES